MSISPIITFKAGQCILDTSTKPNRVRPQPTPGYIYLYSEDDLIHFCWRPRSASLDSPELDLVMVPTDGTFTPYEPSPTKPTNGRIYALKFSSSSQRHLFYLQSRSQHPSADPAWFSARDRKLGQIVDDLLQGEEIDVRQAIAALPSEHDGDDADGDEPMEDVEGQGHDPDHHRGGSGGAGPDATGGDVREEGHEAREGGADGGRAAAMGGADAQSIIQNFIQSMAGSQRGTSGTQEKPFTTLTELLGSASTIPYIDHADQQSVDNLLQYLPPNIINLAREADNASMGISSDDPRPPADVILDGASLERKKEVLRRVLRSPQFAQNLSSLTIALRDGGLPSISDALNIPVRDGGYMRRGGMPLGGGEAVEAFVEGVKDTLQKDQERPDHDEMEQ